MSSSEDGSSDAKPARSWLRKWPPAWRLAVLVAVLGVVVVVWRRDPNARPAVELDEGAYGRFDHGNNALWMRRHWIHEGADPPDTARLARELEALGIQRLYPFLGPMDEAGWPGWRQEGMIRRYVPERAAAFFSALHDEDPELLILPWSGGNLHQDFRPDDDAQHTAFAEHARRLVELGADGIHINVEPLPSGTRSYLDLLAAVRDSLPEDALLSVAAYPPSTELHAFDDVHWSLEYTRDVCLLADELAVMAYDTALRSQGAYEGLVAEWTRDLLRTLPTRAEGGCDVRMGVPSYEDDEPYHDPDVETLEHSLRGIAFGLAEGDLPRPLDGVAIYASWTTDAREWATYERVWRGRVPSDAVVTDGEP